VPQGTLEESDVRSGGRSQIPQLGGKFALGAPRRSSAGDVVEDGGFGGRRRVAAADHGELRLRFRPRVLARTGGPPARRAAPAGFPVDSHGVTSYSHHSSNG